MIQVKELTKRFGSTVAVDRLNFSVQQGEILGFLGPNGAGKSTTMRILTGYFPPTSGQAFIAGHDVVEEPMPARRAVGYLPENVPLYQDMRVREYLLFVGGAKGLDQLATRQEAGRVMDLVGIAERAGQLIKQLSKGYRQRLGLAQALLGDPPVLILDEPTIGLDPRQIVEMRSLVKGFAGRKTVILSSHILSEVAATCDRVVIINEGRLVAQGPPSMLTSEGETCSLRLITLGDEEKVAAVVSRVPGVDSWQAEPASDTEGGVCVFTLAVSGGRQVQAAVAKAVVESGQGLVEMRPLSASLEEVFVRLTAEDKPREEDAA